MSTEYLYPLIGVLFGWSLNEISQLFKERRKNKKIAKRSIFLLIEIRLYLSFINPILQNIISADKLNKDFSEILKDIFENKNFSTNNFNDLSNETIANLSQINPSLALRIKQLASNSKVILHIGYVSSHLSPFNKKGIKLIYEGNTSNLEDINKVINKLTFRYNISLWLKEKLFKGNKLNQKDRWKDLFNKFNN